MSDKNDIMKYNPEMAIAKEAIGSGVEVIKTFCDTYRDAKQIEAQSSIERLRIRKQADVVIEQHREETKRIINENNNTHREHMKLIEVVHDTIDKGKLEPSDEAEILKKLVDKAF